MKKTLSILSLAIFVTTAQVEANAKQAVQEAVSDSQASKATAALKLSLGEGNDITLWETLDADKDGEISKEEANSSSIVTDNWAKLDSNKDEKLDIAEFSQLYSKD